MKRSSTSVGRRDKDSADLLKCDTVPNGQRPIDKYSAQVALAEPPSEIGIPYVAVFCF